MRETLFIRSPNQMEKHKLCLCFPYHYNYTYYNVYPKGRQAYRLLLQTTMEPLPHGLLVLSSSKPLTGRTGHRLRDASVYWNHWRHSLHRTLSHYRTRTRPTTTCLVGTPPLRLHTLQDTPTRHLARHLAGDRRLCIAHPLDTCPSFDTNDISTGHPR